MPADSDKLFAFRLVAYPIPFAETLSTGTIYISTGLISLLDNEAQLAYVLAHEMAHVQLDHWKLKSMLTLGEEEFNKKEATKRKLIGVGLGALGGVVGGKAAAADALDRAAGAVVGAVSGSPSAARGRGALTSIGTPSRRTRPTRPPSRRCSNQTLRRAGGAEAVRHAPDGGEAGSARRARVHGQQAPDGRAARQRGRHDHAVLKPTSTAKQGKLVATHPDFVRVMSTLKRDNGILSFYHDMFQLAKSNLEYARTNRPNDPAAHYYYGKVMKLVGRTDEDRKLADEAFQKAIQFDHRERNYGAHFYRALALIDQKNAGSQSRDRQVAAGLSDGVDAVRVGRSVAGERAAGEPRRPVRLPDRGRRREVAADRARRR